MKILIADDDDSVRRLLAAEIRSLGHEVVEAAAGLEAVEIVATSDPGVVFLDVLMPRLNGFDALARLRSGGFKGKVVIITALSSSTTKRLEAGALPDAMLAKPFRRRDVAMVLKKLELVEG